MKKLLMGLGWPAVAVSALLAWVMLSENRANPELLRARVNEYWQAVRSNDHHTRYKMLTAYAEGKMQPDQLRPQMSPQMSVLAHEIRDIRVEDDGTAQVEVDVTLTLPNFGGKGFHRRSRENWTYVGDNWYRGLRGEYRKQLEDNSGQSSPATEMEVKDESN
jgi:hypothetical protein